MKTNHRMIRTPRISRVFFQVVGAFTQFFTAVSWVLPGLSRIATRRASQSRQHYLRMVTVTQDNGLSTSLIFSSIVGSWDDIRDTEDFYSTPCNDKQFAETPKPHTLSSANDTCFEGEHPVGLSKRCPAA